MKNTSRLLLIFGSVLSFICAGAFFLSMIGFIVISTPAVFDYIRQGIEEGTIHSNIPADVTSEVLLGLFIAYAVIFGVLTIFAIISAIFGLRAKSLQEKRGYVTAIVFGALMSNPLLIAGGIVGIIAKNKEDNNKEEVIDMTK